MRFFLDTEFIEDGRTVDLVSIGVVSLDGDEFYREVDACEINWDKANEWVRTNVRPHLFGRSSVVRRKRQIAHELKNWVAQAPGRPEFWAWFGDYDWVVVCQLFGSMMDLPPTWPKFCMDLKQLHVTLGSPHLPQQDSVQHNALNDARWNLEVYRSLTALQYRVVADEDIEAALSYDDGGPALSRRVAGRLARAVASMQANRA